MNAVLGRRRLLLAPLGAMTLGLAGCGTILSKQPYVPRVDWPLAPPPPAAPVSGRGKGVVLVRDIQAGPGLYARGLMTLEPDGSLHTGYYNQWAVPPSQAATAGLIAWLQASGAFTAVVPSDSALNPTLIVEATLDTLLADLTTHQARAALTLVVAKPHGIGERPVMQRRLTGAASLDGTQTADLVAAQRAALADLLGQAVRTIKDAR